MSKNGTNTRVRSYVIAKPRSDQVVRADDMARPVTQLEVKELKIGKPVVVSVKAASPTKPAAAKPTASISRMVEVVTDRPGKAQAVDASKLDALEKKLKALQDEVDRLKKSAGPDAAK